MSNYSIFKSGDIGTDAYQNIRDSEDLAYFKDWINVTTLEYFSICGDNRRHLENIALNNFDGFLWQVFLFHFFKGKGFKFLPTSSAGPDFCLLINERRVWIEAVSVSRGSGEFSVPEPIYEATDIPGVRSASWCRTHPDPLIKLRLTEVIQRKYGDFGDNGYKDYVEHGIVSASDPYLLAINYGAIPFVFNVVDPSYISMTVFGLGPYSISIDRKTLKAVGGGYSIQPHIEKREQNIESAYFNRTEYSGLSGIIASPSDVFTLMKMVRPQVELVPNPEAKNRIPTGFDTSIFTSLVRFEDIEGGLRIHFT